MMKIFLTKPRGVILLGSLFAMLLMLVGLVHSPQAEAAYDGGNLIDNGSYLNSLSMSKEQIQSFLVSKGGAIANKNFMLNCSSAGAQAEAIYNSIGAPCNYQVPASHIIYYASQVYGLNPQVVITTMQKEQSLITAVNPTDRQYAQAMGYACPTSGSCSDSSNFFWQIDNGTWVLRFHYERARGNNSWWYSGGWTCGTEKNYYKPNLYPGQEVRFYDGNGVHYRTHYIMNAATSSLYCYTPHAYNNPQGLYGRAPFGTVGQYYSGSYNFVYYFELWFNPSSKIASGVQMTNIIQPDYTPARGQTVTYRMSLTNNLSEPVTLSAVGIVGRAGSLNGPNRDFGWAGPVTLNSGATQEFTFTSMIKDTGAIYVWPSVLYEGAYVHYNNWGAALNAHSPNLSLTSPLTSSVSNPYTGQSVTLSATVKNNEDQPINVSALGIPVRYFGTYNYDSTWITPSGSTLAANATASLSGTITLDKAGPYKAWVSGVVADQFMTLSPDLIFNVSDISPNFALSYLETPNTSPALGEDVTIKFKLRNNSGGRITLDAVGLVGRYDNPYTGANSDLGWTGPVTFEANEEKSFTTFSRNISELNNYYAWPALYYKGRWVHYNNWGFMMVPRIPNISISAPLTINSGTLPTRGQTVSVTTTLKNNEPKPIKFSAIGIPARYYGTYNYDATWQGTGTLAATGQSGDSVALSGTINFNKAGPYSVWNSILINGRFITIGNQTNLTIQ